MHARQVGCQPRAKCHKSAAALQSRCVRLFTLCASAHRCKRHADNDSYACWGAPETPRCFSPVVRGFHGGAVRQMFLSSCGSCVLAASALLCTLHSAGAIAVAALGHGTAESQTTDVVLSCKLQAGLDG